MSDERLRLLANALCPKEQSYVLLLGSGLSLTQELLDAIGCETWNDFYEQIRQSKADQFPKLKAHFDKLHLQEGYHCVAQLAKKGYFEAVFTVNTDSLLRNALSPKPSNIDILNSSEQMEKYQPQSSRKVVCLLHGQIDEENCKLTFLELIHLRSTLESLLKTYLKQNLLLVNFTGLGDIDLLHAIPAQGQDIWWISSEQNHNALAYLSPDRLKKEIGGDVAHFNNFFRTLLEIIQAQERERKAKQAKRGRGVLVQPEEIEPVHVKISQLCSYLPSGVLNLYKPVDMPLLKYELYNNTDHLVTFFLEVQSQDCSYPWYDTIKIPPYDKDVCYYLPKLKPEYVKKIGEIRSVSMVSTVDYKETRVKEPLHKKTYEVNLLAFNVICWAILDIKKGKKQYISLFEHIAAWVTPRAISVKNIFNQLIQHYNQKWPDQTLPKGYTGKREYETARRQVRAIYEYVREKFELSDRGTPTFIAPEDGAKRQTVRLPSESLRTKSANCIERAVLYASLIELAGLEPMILINFKDMHALVGWKIWYMTEEYEFLELMLPSTTPFLNALTDGIGQYHQLKQDGWLDREVLFDKNGFARLLDIKKLHDETVRPMSIEDE